MIDVLLLSCDSGPIKIGGLNRVVSVLDDEVAMRRRANEYLFVSRLCKESLLEIKLVHGNSDGGAMRFDCVPRFGVGAAKGVRNEEL